MQSTSDNSSQQPAMSVQEQQQHAKEEPSPRLKELLEIERKKRELAEAEWLKSDLAKGIPHVGLAGGKPRRLSSPPPFEYSPQERITFLQSCLDGTGEIQYNLSPAQQANVKLLIEAYKKGELGPMSTYPKHSCAAACNGKIFDHYPTEEERDGHEVWAEEFVYQMMQGEETPLQQMQQMKTWSAYEPGEDTGMHKFYIEMRLCIHPSDMQNWYPIKDSTLRTLGPNGPRELTATVAVHNDTGSNMLTVFDTDLAALGQSESTYWAMEPGVHVHLAAGKTALMPGLTMDIRVLDRDGHPMTAWFPERGVLVKREPGMKVRLSGSRMRHELYFVTNKSNILITGRSKHAVFQVTDTNWKTITSGSIGPIG